MIRVKPKTRRDRAPVQAQPVIEPPPAPVPVRAPSLFRLMKLELTKAAVLVLMGAVAMSFAPRWLPRQAAAAQEPVVQRHTSATPEPAKPAPGHTSATPEPTKPAPEPARPAPEPVAGPEPARPNLFREASEAVARATPPSTGVFMPETVFGDPHTLRKTGKISEEVIRFRGDPRVLAYNMKAASKHVVPGQVLWAERQPNGDTDIHMLANVDEDEYGVCTNDKALFWLNSEFYACRKWGEYRHESTGQVWKPVEEKLPRELMYRMNGSSLAQH
jgi:hypothetical protein